MSGDGKTANRKTRVARIAGDKAAIKERVEAARPILRGSWVEVKDPNSQDIWVDGPPSRAPSCGDDDTPLPGVEGVKGKAEFVWGWLRAMGGTVQGWGLPIGFGLILGAISLLVVAVVVSSWRK